MKRGSAMDSNTGDRVRNARKRRRMTQSELAQAAGVALITVKKIEQGAYRTMRMETARSLASALGVRTMDLVQQAAPEDTQAPHPDIWAPARDAITSPRPATGEPPDVRGLTRSLDKAVRLYH